MRRAQTRDQHLKSFIKNGTIAILERLIKTTQLISDYLPVNVPIPEISRVSASDGSKLRFGLFQPASLNHLLTLPLH
jgi:hypothetical protein